MPLDGRRGIARWAPPKQVSPLQTECSQAVGKSGREKDAQGEGGVARGRGPTAGLRTEGTMRQEVGSLRQPSGPCRRPATSRPSPTPQQRGAESRGDTDESAPAGTQSTNAEFSSGVPQAQNLLGPRTTGEYINGGCCKPLSRGRFVPRQLKIKTEDVDVVHRRFNFFLFLFVPSLRLPFRSTCFRTGKFYVYVSSRLSNSSCLASVLCIMLTKTFIKMTESITLRILLLLL